MRTLVIGSTSVLGHAVVNRLAEAGHSVYEAGRTSDLRLDVTEGRLPEWASTARFDAVVNLASKYDGDTLEDLRETVLVNSFGPAVVAHLAESAGAKQLIHVSTIYAGDPGSYRGDLTYPMTKLQGEQVLLQRTRASELTVTILRPSHVYDDEGFCRSKQPALYWLVDEVRAGGTPDLPEPGLRRDYLHIDDFCEAIFSALEQRAAGVYEVLSPASHTFAELVAATQAVAQAVQAVAQGAVHGSHDQQPPWLKSKSQLPGFSPAIPIAHGIRRIIEAGPA